MKFNLKDRPNEWRKSALLTLLGLAIITGILRWRGHVSAGTFYIILGVLSVTGVAAAFQPRWFRGYHLLSMRAGLVISKVAGQVALVLFFFLILTPVGLMLKLLGKDSLQLKRPRDAKTYWQPAKENSPLDRLF